MGGIPTNYHGEVLTKVNGDPDSDRAGVDGAGRSGVRVGAWRQQARLEFADRPCRLRPGGGPARAETLKRGDRQPELPKDSAEFALTRLDRFRNAKGKTPTAALRLNMQMVMQNNCAVFRTGDVLAEGKDRKFTPRGARARMSR